MNSWQEDLLNMLLIPATFAEAVFDRIKQAALQLGFEHVAYGFQAPYPVTQPKITLLNSYPTAWQQRYAQAGYLLTDPTVAHGRQSQAPILWNDQAFASNRALWADAQDHGIKTGWAQSCLERSGAGSLLTLCRCMEPLIARCNSALRDDIESLYWSQPQSMERSASGVYEGSKTRLRLRSFQRTALERDVSWIFEQLLKTESEKEIES